MKPLRPITMMALASLLGGIVLAAVMLIGAPDLRTWRGVGFAFGGGAVGGLVMVAPIAAGEAFRQGIARLLGRHASGVLLYVSLLMAVALVFVVVAFLRRKFDAITALAAAVVFVGAWIKILLGVVYDEGGQS